MAKLGKRISYAVLSIIALLCFTFAIVPAIKKPVVASANKLEVLPETTTLSVVESASVRLDYYSGLRFSAVVSEEFYNEKSSTATAWGFLVALGNAGAGLDTETFVFGTEGVAAVAINSWISDSWDDEVRLRNKGLKQFNLVLRSIPVEHFQANIYVRAFVQEGEGVFTYSDNIVGRNVHEVAKAAINDNTASYTDEEYGNLTYYVNQCTADALHSWDSGYYEAGLGWIKTCAVCGSQYISDPAKSWGDGDGVVLDRNGMELHQTVVPDSIVKTFEATIKVTNNLGRETVLFSNMPDYDKRKGVSSNFEILITASGVFKIYYGSTPSSVTFSTSALNSNWYHLAITADPSANQFKLYINGTLKETVSASVSSITAPVRSFFYGRNYHGGNVNGFEGNGAIKNSALWNVVRSASEIATDMNYIYNLDGRLMAMYDFTETPVNGYLEDHSKANNVLVCHETWYDYDINDLDEFAYSMAVIGDTQSLINYYPEKVEEVSKWLLNKKDEHKIGYAIGLGDMLENLYTYHGNVGEGWQTQYEACQMLDGVIPYQLTRGNHDQNDYMNNTFRTDEYMVGVDGMYQPNLPGVYEGGVETSYSIQYVGNYKYLFITLNNVPWADAELAWAGSIIEQHPDARVIISTHAYLAYTGAYGDVDDSNGTVIWENLAKKYPNIMMVLCGHIAWDPILMVDGTGDNGNTVHQFLIDPQYIDQNNGPRGMIAMFYFSEDGSKIQVRYYSSVDDKMHRLENCFTIDTSEYKDLGRNAVDTVAPRVTANNPDEGAVGRRYTLPNALVRDDKDALVVPTYRVYLKSDETKTPIDLGSNNSFVPTIAGAYVWEVTATDLAGNTTVKEFDLIIREKDLPNSILEDFSMEVTLNNYKSGTQAEWLSSFEGAEGVIHFTPSEYGLNYIGYKNYNFKLLDSYQDLDLVNKQVVMKIWTVGDMTYFNGYADYDGYGGTSVIAGDSWQYVPIEYLQDNAYFLSRAKSSAGVRLLTAGREFEFYIDEILVVDKSAYPVGQLNFDNEMSLSNFGSTTNGGGTTVMTNVEWLDEYAGAQGVVKGRSTDYWYGVHFNFNNTSAQLTDHEWNTLEVRIKLDTWVDIYKGDTGEVNPTIIADGEWRIYRFAKSSLITEFGSEAELLRRLTTAPTSRDAYDRVFTFWDLTETDMYIDYVKLVNVQEKSMGITFDTADNNGELLGLGEVTWHDTFDGAQGVVQVNPSVQSDYWYGINLEVPYTKEQLEAFDWDRAELRVSFGTQGQWWWVYEESVWSTNQSGNWVTYTATKEALLSLFNNSLDTFYTALTNDTYGWDGERLLCFYDFNGATEFYIDSFLLIGEGDTAEDSDAISMNFSTSASTSYVSNLTNVTYHESYDGATGVVSGTPTSAWGGFQIKLPATSSALASAEWNTVELKIQLASWDDVVEDNWNYVEEGNWRIYRLTKDQVIKQFYSLDAFYTAITTGSGDSTRLFTLWNLANLGTVYIDYFKLSNLGLYNFASESATGMIAGATSVEVLENYHSANGVAKVQLDQATEGIGFKLGVDVNALESLNWSKFYIKMAFELNGEVDVWGDISSEEYSHWTYTTEGAWRIYTADKDNLVAQFGSLEAFYQALNDGTYMFTLWNFASSGNLYVDYVKFDSAATPNRLVVENDFSSGTNGWLLNMSGLTVTESYDGHSYLATVNPTSNAITVKLPFTKAQLESMNWDRIEFKLRFSSGNWSNVYFGTTTGYTGNKAGWVYITDGYWRTITAKKDNLIKTYGSLDALYTALTTGSVKLIEFSSITSLGTMYIDYIKLV